ncbi:hypothetical protein RZS28_03560 [Methylocapsa polymorpha]|uniref:Uncharacterized protein n=1 Tax=Methylocapsa polymorpha TaxID=3080828 RepID=A0ABZ0HUZ8_9HYPH|nr:hypothetical protein RZS28_03560 [Methylocapsa sp. RX1]
MKSKRRDGNYVQISWIMLGIWREDRKVVRYMDRDRLNLCRDNLKAEAKGAAAGDKRAKQQTASGETLISPAALRRNEESNEKAAKRLAAKDDRAEKPRSAP